MVTEIEKEEENIGNELFKKEFTDYQSPSDMQKKLRKTEVKKIKIKYMQSKNCWIK